MNMKMPAEFQLLDHETIDDPYPFYASLREHAPVYRVPGTDVHLVSKRSLIEEVLARNEDFSANLTGTLMTGPTGEPAVFDLSRFGTPVAALATADEPAHAVHRKIVLPQVTPKKIAAMEPTLRSWAKEKIEPLVAAGGGDCFAEEELVAHTRTFSLDPGFRPRYVRSLQARRHSTLRLLAEASAPAA